MKICATRFIHTQPVAFISHSLDHSGSTAACACSLLFNQVPVLGEEIVSQQLLLFMVIVAHYTHFYAGIYGACVPAEKTKVFCATLLNTTFILTPRWCLPADARYAASVSLQ
jgi:hypothetical protein